SYKTIKPPMIQVTSLDPYFDLTRMNELVKRVPDLGQLRGGGVLVEYGQGEGAGAVVVRNQEMFEPGRGDPGAGTDHFTSVFTGEDALTSALIRLREHTRAKVAFTTGHGEPDTGDLSPQGTGIGNWKSRLAAIGCDVSDLNLVTNDVPPDLSLLIVVGPRSPFQPEELAKLKSHTDRGGPILLLLGNMEPSGLDAFLKAFNLELGRGVVLDPTLNYRGNLRLVLAPAQAAVRHPIASALGP